MKNILYELLFFVVIVSTFIIFTLSITPATDHKTKDEYSKKTKNNPVVKSKV